MDLPQPNNSLINGLALLQQVVTRGEPVGVRELARELNLSATRVSRLLSTLAHLGLVTKNAQRKYRPGPGVHLLAAHSLQASPLLSLALPVLLQFRDEGFTAGLGVLWQRHVCYLFHERPTQGLEDAIGRHKVYPAERSSAGMVLLAEAKASEPSTAEPDVEYLDTSNKWEERMKEIRERGYAALCYGKKEISVGVPIGSPVVAALAISRADLMASQLPPLVDRLKAIAANIDRALTGTSQR